MATAQTAAATNYGMAKAIKKKVGKRTSYRVAGLAKGRTYCFRIRAVRGKTTGKKSNRTCKPTIVAQGATTGAPVRIMTYNICSTKPGCQASWNWATRRPHAAALIGAYQPDVVALQESERGDGIDSELAQKPRVRRSAQGLQQPGLLRCLRPGRHAEAAQLQQLQRLHDDAGIQQTVGRPRRPRMGEAQHPGQALAGRRHAQRFQTRHTDPLRPQSGQG